MELINFEIYYERFKDKFVKQADGIVLFIHWYMVQNRFKCIVDGKPTELLSNQWNACKEYYDFFYQRGETKYRLEIYLIQNLMHIQFKRLSDMCDSLQNITVTDYVNEEYKQDDYRLSFKNLDKLYIRMQKCVGYIKENLNSKQAEQTFLQLVNSTLEKSTEIINNSNYEIRVVDEKISDSETSAINNKKFEKLKEKCVDCTVTLFDCMQTDLFKDKKMPIKLTYDMKKELNLLPTATSNLLNHSRSEPVFNQITNNKQQNKAKTRKLFDSIGNNQTIDSFLNKPTNENNNTNNNKSRQRNNKRKRTSNSSTINEDQHQQMDGTVNDCDDCIMDVTISPATPSKQPSKELNNNNKENNFNLTAYV